MTPRWPSNRRYLFPQAPEAGFLPSIYDQYALPNWQWVVTTLHPIFQSERSILMTTKEERKTSTMQIPSRKTTPKETIRKNASTGLLLSCRVVPLTEAFGAVAAALAMGDGYRRCIPVQGRVSQQTSLPSGR